MKKSKALQLGYGAFGVHLKKHLERSLKFEEVYLIDGSKNFKLESLSFVPDYVFLCTQDQKIKPLAEKLRSLWPKAVLVHFSGAQFVKEALGIHPVFSFHKEQSVDLEDVDYVSDTPLEDSILRDLFKNTTFLDGNKKKIYHSYLSVVANSFQLIANQMGKEFELQTGLKKDLLKKIVFQSLLEEKDFGEKSFSGPWTRGERASQNEVVSSLNLKNLSFLNQTFEYFIKDYNNESSKI